MKGVHSLAASSAFSLRTVIQVAPRAMGPSEAPLRKDQPPNSLSFLSKCISLHLEDWRPQFIASHQVEAIFSAQRPPKFLFTWGPPTWPLTSSKLARERLQNVTLYNVMVNVSNHDPPLLYSVGRKQLTGPTHTKGEERGMGMGPY